MPTRSACRAAWSPAPACNIIILAQTEEDVNRNFVVNTLPIPSQLRTELAPDGDEVEDVDLAVVVGVAAPVAAR